MCNLKSVAVTADLGSCACSKTQFASSVLCQIVSSTSKLGAGILVSGFMSVFGAVA